MSHFIINLFPLCLSRIGAWPQSGLSIQMVISLLSVSCGSGFLASCLTVCFTNFSFSVIMNLLLFPELTPVLMSLSKERGQVLSPTSGDPIDAKTLVKYRKVYLQLTTNRVKSLFAQLASLEERQDQTLKELRQALAIQTEAECNLRSSCLGDFPVLTDADISPVLGMDLSALGDLVLDPQSPLGDLALNLPDPVTTQSAPAPAVRKPKRPKFTILAPRHVTVIGSTTITRAKPGTKPSKWFSTRRPLCQKPSKRACPPTADADLPTSSSA